MHGHPDLTRIHRTAPRQAAHNGRMIYRLTSIGKCIASPTATQSRATWPKIRAFLMEHGSCTRAELIELCRDHEHHGGAAGYVNHIERLHWVENVSLH